MENTRAELEDLNRRISRLEDRMPAIETDLREIQKGQIATQEVLKSIERLIAKQDEQYQKSLLTLHERIISNEESTWAKIDKLQTKVNEIWHHDKNGLISINQQLIKLGQMLKIATWLATTAGGTGLTMVLTYVIMELFGVSPP